MADITTTTALWWAVVLSGLYHGLNPGMGWPLAVSAALMESRRSALPAAVGMLGIGHFLSMLAILLPFSMMLFLVEWEQTIRIGAAVLVIAMGIYLLVNQRHPRFLARVHPSRLSLWSFLAALAHGAGLMLVPIYLGICAVAPTEPSVSDAGHAAAATLMQSNITLAVLVAGAHTLAMTLAGAGLAILVYVWLGLKFLSQTWFNLDVAWATSLVVVGVFAIASMWLGH
ncbi:MAG: hypothetical protein AAFR23_01310 [Pseudomonadota bacterium]